MPQNYSAKEDGKITVSKDGPYLVSGGIPLFKMTISCDCTGDPSQMGCRKKLENYRKLCLMPMQSIQ